MNYKGHNINPILLWGQYADIKEAPGPFLPLTFCPNPNHDNTRSPAFQVNIDKPYVHCFSNCGISGTYEHAICIIEGLYEKWNADPSIPFKENRVNRDRLIKAWREAKKIILRKASQGRIAFAAGSISNKRKASEKLRKVKGTDGAEAAEAYQEITEADLSNFSYLPKEALAFLKKRGINTSSRIRWQIGFQEDTQRIVVPVYDSKHRFKFVLRRTINPSAWPPWIIPAGDAKSALLFGACNLDAAMVDSEGLIVVEGAFDCIRLHQWGYRNTVAVLGSYISNRQKEEIAKLRPASIFIFFDKDASGVWAVQAARKTLGTKYALKIPMYPKGDNLDPAKLSEKQVKRAIARAVPYIKIKRKIEEAERMI